MLRLKWIKQHVLTLCTDGISGADEISLETKDVVVDFEENDGCLEPVYSQLIVFGQCGENFNCPPILCVKPFECFPTPSTSPSSSPSESPSESPSQTPSPSPSQDPCSSEDCSYVWDGVQWVIDTDTCEIPFSGCRCEDPPAVTGEEFEGDIVVVSCVGI